MIGYVFSVGRIRSTGPRRRSWSLSAASRAETRADSTSGERLKSMGPSSWKVGEGRLLVWRKESILTVFVTTDAASFAISDAIAGYGFAMSKF